MSLPDAGTAPKPPPRRQARGEAKRDKIIQAAAELIRADGPSALSHRAVAAHAGVPLAATTYYFDGIDDLLGAAGAVIVAGWADHARECAQRLHHTPTTSPHRIAAAVVDAIIPPGDGSVVRGFYEHLVSAGRYPSLAAAYAEGRNQLDAAMSDLLHSLNISLDPAMVIAVIDGAAVSALSEGHDARGLAVSLVRALLGAAT